MKGLFIPDITAEMFRNGCLESIEALMAEGKIYDIDYSPWIPCSERLPEIHQDVILSLRSLDMEVGFRAETEPYFYCCGEDSCYIEPQNVLAWKPLPEPYHINRRRENE